MFLVFYNELRVYIWNSLHSYFHVHSFQTFLYIFLHDLDKHTFLTFLRWLVMTEVLTCVQIHPLPGSHFSLSSYVVSSFVSCFYLTLLSLLPKNLITNMNSRKCHIVRHCSQKFHTLNWLFILDSALVVTHTNIDAITAPSKFIMVLEACQSWPYPEQYASLLRKKPSADTEVLI